MVPWVCAPHQSNGTGGTTEAAISFLTSRLPTCGPLPCVTTTSCPSATTSAIRSRGHADGSDLVLRPRPTAGRRHRVAAQSNQYPHSATLSRALAGQPGAYLVVVLT